ncbi:MAG: asparagine synthase (glutamine-hydrolyzing), partial [Fimbriimonadaceae bacterium]
LRAGLSSYPVFFMCGIAGILNTRPGPREELQGRLEALNAAQRHRGPDDQGTWISPQGHAGLAHVRLSILDLSPAGHQPMHSADGRLVICFNGEIYNFRELREELEREGEAFLTRSDTEVLLRLYERDGAAMVERLRGMFAFCLWDEREQTALLARDPLGVKPLYYLRRGGLLAFASEVRALRKTGLASRELDGGALVRYFESGSVAEPDTLLKDVRCLPAGHTLVWRAGETEIRQFWKLGFGGAQVEEAEAVERVRAALLDSVRHHFVSDVPVGVFLSGGIDSTSVLALAIAAGQRDLETFSIGVDDVRLDESSAAARTAAHFGTRHHELRLDASTMAASFPKFLASMDQPSIDGFNTFTVAGFARAQGMKVVLSGLGGDELFGGYPSFDKVPRLARLARLLHGVPGMRSGAGMLERHLPRPQWRRAAGLLTLEPSMTRAWQAFRGVFSPQEARLLASRHASDMNRYEDCREADGLSADDEGDQVSELELSRYMRNQLLKDSDVMSMSHGLELRVPLVDRALFESAAAIPAGMRLQPGKRLLVKAVPELPAWITEAPKRGFLFPYQKWLDSEWGDAFKDVAGRLPGSKPGWYQLWSLFMLERWLEIH